jgi:ribosomal protein S18 acetylase RimI-like enzyme
MATGLEVRRLRASEWREFRELRLAALRTDPTAFGSTLAEALAFPDEEWQRRARNGAEDPFAATFVAVGPGGKFHGMIGSFRSDGEIHLWGMWVDPARRGRKLGAALLDRLLGFVAAAAPDRPVILEVNRAQASAERLYRSRGFAFDGTVRPLGHDSPAEVHRMVRPRA